MKLFKKKSTGVEISEYFMKVNETPDEAIARASREYDIPEAIYYDKDRNILKAIGDANSTLIKSTVPLSSTVDDTNKKDESTEKQSDKEEEKDSKSPELFGKTSKLGMGIPKLKAIDNANIAPNALKNKPFFKKNSKGKSYESRKRRVSADELSEVGGENDE